MEDTSKRKILGEEELKKIECYKRRPSEPVPEGMTKSAFKKMKRQQATKEKWAQKKIEKKEKAARKKQQMRELKEKNPELWKKLKPEYDTPRVRKSDKTKQITEAIEANEAPKIVIDCSFEDKMTEKESKSNAQQCFFAFGAVSSGQKPTHLHLTSYGGLLKEQAEKIAGNENWPITRSEQHYLEYFKNCKDKLVYLTADADDILDELDPSNIYIIGGIVDRNRFKGGCHSLAREAGIKTARLPIGEYLNMTTRKVLTTFHGDYDDIVCDLLIHRFGGSSWQEAMMSVLPARKGAELKDGEDTENGEGEQLDETDACVEELQDEE